MDLGELYGFFPKIRVSNDESRDESAEMGRIVDVWNGHTGEEARSEKNAYQGRWVR